MKSNYMLNRKSLKSFWKSFLLIMFFGCYCKIVGQSVTIPASNANELSFSHPFGSCFGFQDTSMIYTAAELELVNGTKITKIDFYLNSFETGGGLSNFTVRMINTTESVVTASTFATEVAGAQDVLFGFSLFQDFTPPVGWGGYNLAPQFTYT